MSITWADVQVIAPELTDTAVPTGTQAVLLAMVDRQIDDTAWDDLADDGRRYLAAHMGTVYVQTAGGSADSVGPVTSESLGPMSRGYASAAANSIGSFVDPLLGTTRYGIWYLHMVRLLPSAMGFVP
jgi:hypothetical protein